jgi:hypothetical protein
MVMALVVLTSTFSIAALALPASAAYAATMGINQCNGIGATAKGATTGLTCTVTVVNTINGATTGSTTTVTRQCSLGPCPAGNGTFTTSSTSLVTDVHQCNGSANDAAPPLITCRVSITNNISPGTPGASPVTAATVNQCVGTGTGAGKYDGSGPRVCDPYPASTTGATITQCNGSVTGGGSTAICSVASASKVSPAIPISVNQCNGTGNKGGTLLTCSTSITTNIVASAQVSRVPSGPVGTGGGSSAGLQDTGLLMLGAGLLLAAAISALLGWRVARRDAATDGANP